MKHSRLCTNLVCRTSFRSSQISHTMRTHWSMDSFAFCSMSWKNSYAGIPFCAYNQQDNSDQNQEGELVLFTYFSSFFPVNNASRFALVQLRRYVFSFRSGCHVLLAAVATFFLLCCSSRTALWEFSIDLKAPDVFGFNPRVESPSSCCFNFETSLRNLACRRQDYTGRESIFLIMTNGKSLRRESVLVLVSPQCKIQKPRTVPSGTRSVSAGTVSL